RCLARCNAHREHNPTKIAFCFGVPVRLYKIPRNQYLSVSHQANGRKRSQTAPLKKIRRVEVASYWQTKIKKRPDADVHSQASELRYGRNEIPGNKVGAFPLPNARRGSNTS